MNTCYICKTDNPDDAVVCSKCYAALTPRTEPARPPESGSMQRLDLRHGAMEEKDYADEEGWWWWREAYAHALDGEWIPVLVTEDGRVFVSSDREGVWIQLKLVNASGGGGGRWCKIPTPPDWEMPQIARMSEGGPVARPDSR